MFIDDGLKDLEVILSDCPGVTCGDDRKSRVACCLLRFEQGLGKAVSRLPTAGTKI